MDDLSTPSVATVTLSSQMADRAGEAAGVLRLLAHPSRLLILCALVEGEASVSALQARLGEPQALVSQQLARLRKMGLVKPQRSGRVIVYRLSDPRVAQILHALHAAYCGSDSEQPKA
ncbi:MAG: metalloregulator ArsR/SmtB family transcription factor [Pseudomonadota bacterium]